MASRFPSETAILECVDIVLNNVVPIHLCFEPNMSLKSTKAQKKLPATLLRKLPQRGARKKTGTSAEQQQDSSPVHGTHGNSSSRSRSKASTSSDLTDLSLSDASEEDVGGVSRDVDMRSASAVDRQSSPTRGATNPSQSYGQLFSPAHSRVGSTIARPNYSSGIKTYGRKRSLRPASELPQTPEAGPSRLPATPNSSPLTPLTPTPSPTKRKTMFSPLSASSSSPSKRKRIVNEELDDSISTFHETPSKRRTFTSKHTVTPSPGQKTSRQADVVKRTNSSPRRKGGPSKPDDWSLDSLGTLVWVRIDKDNALLGDSSTETYWWPAKLHCDSSSDGLLRVTLFCPPSVSNPATIDIPNPSKENIVSQTDNLAKLRFDSDTFRVDSTPNLASSSPRKKHLNDLDSRWHAARRHMIEEDEILNDGFPSSITAVFSHISGTNVSQRSGRLPSLTPSTPMASAKGKRVDDSHALNWSPPPPDITINIPGEVVFSKEKKSKSVYWPARVDAYLPPRGPDEKPKYRLTFLDNHVIEVTRDMFLIYDQEEFGTCRLGKFESTGSLDAGETLDKIDYDDFLHPNPSFRFPEPSLPPPPPETFCQLPMIEQLAFVIPTLTKGGKSRAALSQQVLKGLLTNLELTELQKILFQWAGQIAFYFDELQKTKADKSSLAAAEDIAMALPTTPFNESSISEQADVASNNINDRGNNGPFPTSDMNFSASSPTRDHGMDSSTIVPTSPIQLPPSSLPASSIISEVQEKDVSDQTSREASANPADQSPQLRSSNPLIENNSQESASGVERNNVNVTQYLFIHLTNSDRINYVTDVLFPEAIIQLLLWRSGERTSLQPLPENEENSLYERGCELTTETDFVLSAMRLRKAKERQLGGLALHSNKRDKPARRLGGSRSRPRMIAN